MRNLFGSDAVNVALFIVLDRVHLGGPALAAVRPVHALSALVGARSRASRSRRSCAAQRARSRVEPGSVLIVLRNVIGLDLVFRRRAGG